MAVDDGEMAVVAADAVQVAIAADVEIVSPRKGRC
jgi:hypothetical protein